jgi:alkylated DNA repair protein alkB family protein 8
MEASVSGFILHRDFITSSMEDELMKEIESQKWVVDYDRRLQYYGYRNELEKPYDLIPIPLPMPPLIKQLSEQIVDQGIVVVQPDQVIINEYLPGQGIRPHKDRNYFENQICGINLGSGCIMRFLKGTEVVDIEVPRRSLYVMQDEVRYKWKHAIPPRKKDMIEGNVQHRERRWSITYRKVKISKVKSINPEGKVAGMLKDIYGLTI